MKGNIIGADTAVDDLLSHYFPGRPKSTLYQLFESEQSALLAALLMEMRGDDVDQDVTGDSEAVYYTESGIAVDDTTEESTEWDFTADSVTVYGFEAPIAVAFNSPSKTDRLIELTPAQSPFSISPPGGLNASTLWYRKQDSSGEDTELNVIAFR